MTYEGYKFLHLLGVVLLVGNVTVSAVWKVFADRTHDGRVVAFAQHMVTVTDIGLTATGIGLILVGGYGAVMISGLNPFSDRWLVWGQILFGLSGAIWVAILVPLQIGLARKARTFSPSGEISAAYRHQSRLWLLWGIIATLPLVAALWVMVAKA